MISYEIVKKLELKIDTFSTSLIVTVTGPLVWSLEIIKDLPIEIEDTRIPITVEVVPATSYSLLLRNDLSRKVKANYNWTNRYYSFK